MRSWWRRYGLLAVVLTLIVGGGAGAVLVSRATTERSVAIRQADREALRSAVAELAGGYMSTVTASLLDQTAAHEFELELASAADAATLRDIGEGSVFFDQGVVLTDLTGRPLSAWSPDGVLPPASDPGFAPMREALARREAGVSSLLSVEGRRLMAFALPVPDAAAPEGLLVGFVRFDGTGPSSQFLDGLDLGSRARLFLTDATGTVVAGDDPASVGWPTPAARAHEAAAAGRSGFLTDLRDGTPYVGAFAPIDGPGGLAITIEEPEADFLGPMRTAGTRVQLPLLALLAVAAAVITVLHHRRQAVLQQLADQALRDPLTGLPNRVLFTSRLDAALVRPSGAGGVALLFCDLDGFKQVNDGYGHAAGDRLLMIVGERLRGCVREGDLVARMGGDEFTVLLEGTPDDAVDLEQRARQVAERITESVAGPVDLGLGRPPVRVGVSIGVSVLGDGRAAPAAGPAQRGEVPDLLRLADDAMYRAKARGGGHVLADVGS